MKQQFHISNIDDIFAKIFVEAPFPHKMKMSFEKASGHVSILDINSNKQKLGEGIDFELSTAECCGLNSMQLSDYLGKTVHTSSAHEFFDFVFAYCSEVEFDMEFKEGSWVLKINSYE